MTLPGPLQSWYYTLDSKNTHRVPSLIGPGDSPYEIRASFSSLWVSVEIVSLVSWDGGTGLSLAFFGLGSAESGTFNVEALDLLGGMTNYACQKQKTKQGKCLEHSMEIKVAHTAVSPTLFCAVQEEKLHPLVVRSGLLTGDVSVVIRGSAMNSWAPNKSRFMWEQQKYINTIKHTRTENNDTGEDHAMAILPSV